MKDTQKREEATTMKVSDKARGLHDYLAEYRDVPADIAEAEFTEEALQFMEAAVEAEKQQRAERERCDQEFEAQAEANLKIIFDIPRLIAKISKAQRKCINDKQEFFSVWYCGAGNISVNCSAANSNLTGQGGFFNLSLF